MRLTSLVLPRNTTICLSISNSLRAVWKPWAIFSALAILVASFQAMPYAGAQSSDRSTAAISSGAMLSAIDHKDLTPMPNGTLASYGKIPLSFEPNRGQAHPAVRFVSRGQGYSLFLTDREAVLALSKHTPAGNAASKIGRSKASGMTYTADIIRMQIDGARQGLLVSALDELPGKASYLIGNDPSQWQRNLPTYARVRYTGVYDGVDLIYYGNQRQLEYDFVVAPGGNPKLIRLHFSGAKGLHLDSDGDLRVVGEHGEVAFEKPVIYQLDHGRRELVRGAFRLLADNTVGFWLGAYDRSKALVIDPILSYSTYLGGSSGDAGAGIAVDSSGNAYVTGVTYSSDFPVTAGAYGPSTQGTGAPEAFVTKMNPSGTALVYSTYIGGSGDAYGGDGASAIEVDSKGDAYIAGTTFSENFPVVGGFIQSINNCINAACVNGFVTEVNPTGSGLVNSTYIGGGGQGGIGDFIYALALDSSGNVYLTGSTASTDFPVTSGAYQTSNKSEASAFIAKLSSSFTTLDYSTFLGGTTTDSGAAIAVDSSGDAYVTGSASSSDFPVTSGSYQQTKKSTTGDSAFVTKLNPSGSALIYSTFLGGSGSTKIAGGDAGNGIAVDSAGNATVAGSTASSDFPVTPAVYQTTNKDATNLGPSCFVTRLNATGSALVYSTFLGGSGAAGDDIGDSCAAVAIDASDDAYVVGTTASSDFPVSAGAVQSVNNNPSYGNAFLTELNPTGSALMFSSFLGGSGGSGQFGDSAVALSLDTAGDVYITGKTASSDFPLSESAYQTVDRGSGSGFTTVFISKIDVGSTTPVATTVNLTANPNPQPAAQSVTFTAVVSPALGNEFPTGVVDFLVDGTQVSSTSLVEGQATYATSTLAQGTHTIKANFAANANFAASTASLTETVTEVVAATPSFSPAPGSYPTAQSVTLTDTTAGAVIYYTTNGTTPTTASSKYTGPVGVSATETIEAIAVAPNYANSVIASGRFTIQPNTAIPTFSPAPGSYDTEQTVSIADVTAGATIYYTTDGSTPTATSSVYTAPIVVDFTQTINVIAILAGHANSAIASGTYTITAGPTTTPTFTPVAGTYVGAQSITMNETNTFATVYYTIDGTTPTINSKSYFQPILIGGSATIKAFAVGGTLLDPIISPTSSATYTITASSAYPINTIAGNGQAGYTGNNGAGTGASLNGPTDMAVDANGNVFIADSANNVIRKVTAGGIISTYAGKGTAGFSGDGGAANLAELSGPSGVAIDGAGNLYIADAGNSRIRKVTTAGTISTYAGNGTAAYTGDGGAATSATLNGPAGMAFDSAGNLYISEINNNVIRKVTAATVAQPIPIISTFAGGGAGSGTLGFAGDGGPGTAATLQSPSAVAVDSSGNVYIADTGNSVVRKVSASGIISTFAGDWVMDFSGQGVAATSASLYGPQGVVVDAAGNVYISDTANNCIRVVNSAGIITIFAGTGFAGFSGDGGPATVAQMNAPSEVKLDSQGDLYIADYGNNRVRKVTLPAITVAAAPTFSVAAGTYSTSQTVALADATTGAAIYYTTDGSTPTTASTHYATAIPVPTTETINAIAVATGYSNSAVASATYTINTAMAATPTFSPAAGTYTSPQSVTISDSTTGAVIYYTTDGSRPSASSTKYTAAINVSTTETINAIAVATGYSNSAVASAAYTLSVSSATFSISSNPTSLTIAPGSSGTAVISITSQTGFASTITFACSGLPAGATCSFSPATVTPVAGAAATTTLTVSAAATTASLRHEAPPTLPGKLPVGAMFAVAVCLFGVSKRHRLQLVVFLAFAMAGLSALSGCGGSPAPKPSTVIVTATSGTIQETLPLSITIK